MPISDKKWREYHVRLAGLARNKLGGTPRALKDEDDIAASALKSFFGGVEEGRFQIPEEEEFSLWPLLAVIAARKCAKLIEYLRAGKRDPGRLDDAELDQLVDSISSPASVAEHEEGKQQLLAALDNDRQRQIAIWKMEGLATRRLPRNSTASNGHWKGKWS